MDHGGEIKQRQELELYNWYSLKVSPLLLSIFNPKLITSSADVMGSKSPCLPRSHPEPSPTPPHQHPVDRAPPPSRRLHRTPHCRRPQPACLPVHSGARRRLSAAGPELPTAGGRIPLASLTQRWQLKSASSLPVRCLINAQST
jgi:hypothetical protein